MANEEQEWRSALLQSLRLRNSRDVVPFKEIIQQNNRLLDNVAQLESDKLKLSVENQQLCTVISAGGGKDGNAAQQAIAALEKKLLTQQEELTDLHKRKGENSQLIVDLNIKMEKYVQLLAEKEQSLLEQISLNKSLKAEVNLYNTSLEELKNLNTTVRDEHTALQLAFNTLTEKLRKVQDENRVLVERLMGYKSKDADKLNEENENFLKKRSDKLIRDIEEATRDVAQSSISYQHRSSLSPSLSSVGTPQPGSRCFFGDNSSANCEIDSDDGCPTVIHLKFPAHDAESHAVCWSPTDRVIATGATDRKIKLWDVGMGSYREIGVLSNNSASINSVNFDCLGTSVIGASNDFSSRIWSTRDNRIRHTLTGHSAKVMSAKFINETYKVITGSYDRTIKIWDLRSMACIETKFPGSSCNDVVTTDSLGSICISGHFDKKIRFWDIRTNKEADEYLMNAKITSLDLSKDGNYLICSTRDDTINLFDIRKNRVLKTYSHENFKLSCDWARAVFNGNATKIACGSLDGIIYIWNVAGNLEAEVRGHTGHVNAVSWCSNWNAIASVGKDKTCIIHTES